MNKLQSFTYIFVYSVFIVVVVLLYRSLLLSHDSMQELQTEYRLDTIKSLNLEVQNYMDDPIVINLTDKCKEKKLPAKCVVKEVSKFYNYSYRNDTLILSPTEFKEKGGVCRDSSVLYGAVFNKLGWDTKFIFPENLSHVFVVVSNYNDTYCTIDATDLNCNVLGD